MKDPAAEPAAKPAASPYSEIRCPNCSFLYRVPTDTLRSRRRLRCSNCSHVFPSALHPDAPSPPAAESSTPQQQPPKSLFISPEKEQAYLSAVEFSGDDEQSFFEKVPDHKLQQIFMPSPEQTPDPKPPPSTPIPSTAAPPPTDSSKHPDTQESQMEQLANWTTSQASTASKTAKEWSDVFSYPGQNDSDHPDFPAASSLQHAKKSRRNMVLGAVALFLAIAAMVSAWGFWLIPPPAESQANTLFTLKHWPQGEVIKTQQNKQLLVINGSITHHAKSSQNLSSMRLAAVVFTGAPPKIKHHTAFGWAGPTLSPQQLRNLHTFQTLIWQNSKETQLKASKKLPPEKPIPFQLVLKKPLKPISFLEIEVLEYTLGDQRVQLKSQYLSLPQQYLHALHLQYYTVAQYTIRLLDKFQRLLPQS